MERARDFRKLSFNSITKGVWVVGTGSRRQMPMGRTLAGLLSLLAFRTWHVWALLETDWGWSS